MIENNIMCIKTNQSLLLYRIGGDDYATFARRV